MDECSYAGGDEDKDKMFILRTHLWCRYKLQTSFILTGLGVDLSGVQPALNPALHRILFTFWKGKNGLREHNLM